MSVKYLKIFPVLSQTFSFSMIIADGTFHCLEYLVLSSLILYYQENDLAGTKKLVQELSVSA